MTSAHTPGRPLVLFAGGPVTFLILVILGLLPGSASAQDTDPTSGLIDQRVRLTLRGTDAEIAGWIRSLDPDALTLVTEAEGEQRIARERILRVERSLGTRDHLAGGLLWGGGTGLVLGGAFGLLLDHSLCGIGSCDPSYGAAFLLYGGVGLLAGTVVGGVIGWALSGEAWEEVPPGGGGWRSSLLVAPAPDRITVGIRLTPPLGTT